MSMINEVNRRSMYHEDEGIACGPAGSTAIMAEIVVEVDGQQIFLFGEWVDIAGDYYYKATTESLFDASEKMLNACSDAEEQEAFDERDRIIQNSIKEDSVFEQYFSELEQMIHDEMKAHNIEYYYEGEDE